MKTRNNTRRTSTLKGFSLFELLSAVVILGFLVLMAISSFNSTDPVKQAVHKQNAQNFCTLAYAASAAGVNVVGGDQAVIPALRRLVEGVTVTRGPFANSTFKVPNMDEELITEAAAYIEVRDGELIYNSNKSFVSTN